MLPDREHFASPPASPRDPRWLSLWPLLLGALAFFALGGAVILAPGNVGWLGHGDLAQSYLGWAFYRDAPWQWPPGANPRYGLEIASSVYYSDSIPWLAMALKPFSPLLPETFQYFGLWVLACLMLQALFAWKLAGLATRDALIRTVAVLLLVTAPPMLARLSGHMALVAHWPILAALYLYLRPQRWRPTLCWASLIAVAMGIHAYVFVMVGVVWFADLVRRHREDAEVPLRARRTRAVKESVAVIGAALLSAWVSGLFAVSGGGMRATGFGHYKMNLLAPFHGAGWSALGLNVQTAAGEFDGFNYLGAGVIVLAALAIVLAVTRAPRHRWSVGGKVLLSMALLLTALALTHNIGLGGWQLQLPLPAKLVHKLQGSPVQATGRLFWVVYYLIVVVAMFTVVRTLPRRTAQAVLVGVLALQLFDLSAGLSQVRRANLARATMPTPSGFESAFWDRAGGKYSKLRRMPTVFAGPEWEAAAFYARRHGMATEIVQVARIDVDPFWALDQRKRERLFEGAPEADALYLLDDGMAGIARAALRRPDDALFRIDGRVVLAPGWGTALPAGAIDLRGEDAAGAGAYRLPYRADLAKGSQARSLLSADGEQIGQERTRVRMVGATLFLPAGDDPEATLEAVFELQDLTPAPTGARLDVLMEGKRLARVQPDAQGRYRVSVRVPPSSSPARFRRLDLDFEHAQASERQARKWRLGLDSLEVRQVGG